jgi:hypothetical protein
MFKKIESVSTTINRDANRKGSYGTIYKGKTAAFNLNVSKHLLTEAQMVIGDRASIHLAEDSKGHKWMILEADPTGYMLVAAVSNQKGLSEKKKGTFDRAVWKTTYLDNFLTKYFSEKRFVWSDEEAKVRVGSVAFPLEKRKLAWF